MKKVYLEYTGYLTSSIEETFKYTEYILENINKNFINGYNKKLRIEKLKKILNEI